MHMIFTDRGGALSIMVHTHAFVLVPFVSPYMFSVLRSHFPKFLKLQQEKLVPYASKVVSIAKKCPASLFPGSESGSRSVV